MNCKNCGAVLSPDAVFCPSCGTQNYPVNQNQQTMWTPHPQPKKTNTGLIAAVIVMAVIIVAGIAAIIGYSVGNNNEDIPVIQPTENATQNIETTTHQPETTTEAPVTTAPTTSAPATAPSTTKKQQAVPTFTYNDNNYDSSSEFLFNSANEYITRSYLSTCTRDEITIIMNEMYARHGYIFKDAELREYFNSQSWYTGYTTSMEEAAKHFNSIESANLNTIYQYQKDMGWRQ